MHVLEHADHGTLGRQSLELPEQGGEDPRLALLGVKLDLREPLASRQRE